MSKLTREQFEKKYRDYMESHNYKYYEWDVGNEWKYYERGRSWFAAYWEQQPLGGNSNPSLLQSEVIGA